MRYIEQLTWLRGIAAFFVIVSHTVRATEVKYNNLDQISHSLPMSLLDIGDFGVLLFFALSGCTLYLSNANKLKLNSVHNFYIKRVFRIWPAFVVSLVAYMIFIVIFKHYYGPAQGAWIERQFYIDYSIDDIGKYLGLIFNYTGPRNLFNGAYWSLPVEFQYYLIFPLLVFSLQRIGIVGPIIVGGACYLIPSLHILEMSDYRFFTFAFTFCGGLLVGWIFERFSFQLDMLKGSIIFLISTLLVIMIIKGYIKLPEPPGYGGQNIYVGILSIVAVYVALITQFRLHGKMEAALKTYGEISYSTYLYHNLFIGIAVLLIINLEIYHPQLRLWFTFFFTLIGTLYLAKWSYSLIEKPSINMGRKIISRNKKPLEIK